MVDPATPDTPAQDAPAVDDQEAQMPTLGRRRFLTYLVAAPTLTVGARLAFEGEAAAADPIPSLPTISDLGDFGDLVNLAATPTQGLMHLEVTEQGRIRFELPRAEVGQGLTTTVAVIIAEEMDTRVSDVDVELSVSRTELMWNQFTGASTSVRTLWDPLRRMAADARARLVTAAADTWRMEADKLTTDKAKVHAPDGRSLGYGALSAAASEVHIAKTSSLPKSTDEYTVIGAEHNRIDARDIVSGKAKYSMDLHVPGALPTVVVRPPTLNASVATFDAGPVEAMPGVRAVTEIDSGIAISAETFHHAIKAKDKLRASWEAGPLDDISDADIQSDLAEEASRALVPVGLMSKKLEADFDFAFVSHAPMEVINATAHVHDGKAEVWCPAQTPLVAQTQIGTALGMLPTDVTVHVTRAGGSFGRWLFFDAAIEAAQVSKKIGKPVKLMWTRNDDTRHGRMRPATHHKVVTTHSANSVTTFQHRMAGVEVDLRHGLGEMVTSTLTHLVPPAIDQLFFTLTQSVPYDFGGVGISLAERTLDVPTGSWRSVHSASFRTAEEIVVDDLAKEMGKDPVQFRLEFLKTTESKAVLRTVADAGNWGRSMPTGWAQGIASHEEHRSQAACLVEINATNPQYPRVTKAVMAIDVGCPINPRGLKAQMEGGLMDAISTVLRASVHIDKGAVREGSFSDFLWVRQRHSPPEIEVYIMPANRAPGGAGELGVPVASAAVANAYARATRTKPRRFPINF